jgi:hypothetical protein
MSETQHARWERVKAWREREDKLKAHPLGALFLAYERARADEIHFDLRIEASDDPSQKLIEKSRAAQLRASSARNAFIDELLK